MRDTTRSVEIDGVRMFRLREAAERAGVSPAQLEYYLMCGLLEPTALSLGRQRLFDRRVIQRIRIIALANAGGYPLREVREIFTAPRQRA